MKRIFGFPPYLLLLFVFFNYSCKKNETFIESNSTSQVSGLLKREDLPEWFLKKSNEMGKSVTYVINQKKPAVLVNSDESRIFSYNPNQLQSIPCDSEEDDLCPTIDI